MGFKFCVTSRTLFASARARAGRLAVTSGLWMLMLAACAHGGRECLKVIPPPATLVQQGLIEVPNVPQVFPTTVFARGILGLATYAPAPTASKASALAGNQFRLLFALNKELYSIAHDGTDLRDMKVACSTAMLAISPDQRWILCRTTKGPVLTSLRQDTNGGPEQRPFQLLDASGHPLDIVANDAIWSPDGAYLAVATEMQGCAFALFTASATSPAPIEHLAVVLHFPASVSQRYFPMCDLNSLKWSPDGQWLAFSGQADKPPTYAFQLPVKSLIQGAGPGPIIQGKVPEDLAPVAQLDFAALPTLTWAQDPTGALLLYYPFSESHGHPHLMALNIKTGQVASLASAEEGRFSALAAAPDGKSIVLTHEIEAGNNCGSTFPRGRLYIYTPR